MKSGSGDDPFADPAPEEDGEEEPTEEEELDELLLESEDEEPESNESTDDDEGEQFPYVMRRSKVKEDRDDVHQFFLRDEAAQGETQLLRELEDELGKDVMKLDAREAAYLVAQRHPEEVAEVLRDWGYEHL